MKNRIFTSLAVLALVATGAVACSDDDAAALLTPGSALTQLAAKDPALAFAAAYAGFAGGVAPASITISSDDNTAGDAEDLTVQALGVNVNVAYSVSEGAAKGADLTGSIGMFLFVRGNEVFYVSGSNGALIPGRDDEVGVNGSNPYAVFVPNLAMYDGPDGDDGFYINNSSGNWIVEGESTTPTAGLMVNQACPALPNFTVTGDGTSIETESATAEGVSFGIGLDEVTAKTGAEGDFVMSAEDVDIPIVNVDVTLDCEYTPTES